MTSPVHILKNLTVSGSPTGRTRLAQVATGLGLLGATAVAMVGLPADSIDPPPADINQLVPPPPAQVHTPQPAAFPLDNIATAERFSRIANRPKPVIVEQPKADPLPPQASPQATITYHGIVTMGSLRFGLIKHDGKQRFVSIGAKVGNDLTVASIEPERLVLEPDLVIPLAERTGSAVTVAGGTSIAPRNPALGRVVQPGQRPVIPTQPAVLNPFQQAQLAKGKGKGERFTNDGVRIPSFVQPGQELAWRRARVSLLRTGEFNADDVDKAALKLIGSERADEFAKGDDTLPPEDRELELDFERSRTPEGKGE
jgi:hypothetical protein